jgi:hypothetical protein
MGGMKDKIVQSLKLGGKNVCGETPIGGERQITGQPSTPNGVGSEANKLRGSQDGRCYECDAFAKSDFCLMYKKSKEALS